MVGCHHDDQETVGTWLTPCSFHKLTQRDMYDLFVLKLNDMTFVADIMTTPAKWRVE